MFDIFFNGRKAKYPSTHFPVRPCVYIIIILFPFPSSGIARSDLLLSFFLSLARRSYPLDEGRIRRKKEAAYLDPSQHAFFMCSICWLSLSLSLSLSCSRSSRKARSFFSSQQQKRTKKSFYSSSAQLFCLPFRLHRARARGERLSYFLSPRNEVFFSVLPSGADNLY